MQITWHHVQKGRSQPPPNIRKRVHTHVTSEFHHNHNWLSKNTSSWNARTLVDCHRQSWLHIYLQKNQASNGIFIIPQTLLAQTLTRFPLDDKWIASPQIIFSATPELRLRKAVCTTMLHPNSGRPHYRYASGSRLRLKLFSHKGEAHRQQ